MNRGLLVCNQLVFYNRVGPESNEKDVGYKHEYQAHAGAKRRGGVAEKANKKRADGAANNGRAHNAGKRAVMLGNRVQGQREDDRVHKAHGKTNGRKSIAGNAAV